MREHGISLGIAAMLLALLIAAVTPAGAREFSIAVEPNLTSRGIAAGVAAVPEDAVEPTVTVFITHAEPFHGRLYVKGFRDDGTEIARSAFVGVKAEAQSGGNVRFTFDRDTRLEQVASCILSGDTTPVKKSMGEEAREIIQELLR